MARVGGPASDCNVGTSPVEGSAVAVESPSSLEKQFPDHEQQVLLSRAVV